MVTTIVPHTTTLTGSELVCEWRSQLRRHDDIITGAGSTATGGGQGPLVSLFDGRTLAEIDSFFVDDTDTTHGIFGGGSPRRRR